LEVEWPPRVLVSWDCSLVAPRETNINSSLDEENENLLEQEDMWLRLVDLVVLPA
jgi:hypothetical protein